MCVMKVKRTLEESKKDSGEKGTSKKRERGWADRTKYSDVHECKCHTETHYFMCSLKQL